MPATPRKRPSPVVLEFRRALRDCEHLYRDAAQQIVRFHPELLHEPPADFLTLMLDLHRGLLIKAFVDVAQVDWHWSREERVLGAELVEHVWDRKLRGEQLKRALEHMVNHADLEWGSLVRPFAELPPLRDSAGHLETVVLRIANLVAKADGGLCTEEVQQLEWIQRELDRHLHRVPVAAPGQHEAAQAAASGSTRQMFAEGQEIRAEAQLEPQKPPPVPKEKSPEEELAEALAELDALIGLASIKDEIHELVNFLKIQERRAQMGLPKTPVSLHLVFAGNPGTGKTTVARIVGRIYGAMGLLAKGHLIETDRSGLVAEYAGQTGPKTNKKVDEALDGVLFIDEAYSLVAESGDDPFGAECVQALLKRMEDDRKRLVIILAGYPEPLDALLRSNPGLSSRFSRMLTFPNYSAVELGRIFEMMCEKNRYKLPALARVKLLLGFQYLLESSDEHFGNGRLARNVFEGAIRRLANRIASIAPLTRALLTTIEHQDIQMKGVPAHVWEDLNSETRRFHMACPGCSEHIALRPDYLGRRLQCKHCGEKFRADWAEPDPSVRNTSGDRSQQSAPLNNE
jgi:tellurite resistance protein